MRTLILLILSLPCFNVFAQPIPQKFSHKVIIDTDCTAGDLRAIGLLLSNKAITVKAVLFSDGIFSTETCVAKLDSLLTGFHVDNIPLVFEKANPGISSSENKANKNPEKQNGFLKPEELMPLSELVSSGLINESDKTEFICFGPLANIAKLIRDEGNISKAIEKIIWYRGQVDDVGSYNFAADSVSAKYILNTGIKTCQVLKPVRFQKIAEIFGEELAAVYLMNPDLFEMVPLISHPNLIYSKGFDEASVNEVINDLLMGTYIPDENVVFTRFPTDRSMFRYDVRPIIDTAIALYGPDEWKANVMTDEFHGHLGVFSIVGAKMGIRAREYFGVGPDMLKARSYAGSKPPYSCLNDGIQVSTGATVGMGTFFLANDSLTRPSAIFTYKNRSILISLKKEFLQIVDADIKEGILKYGLMDDGYWKLIRRNALKYWVEWDRNKIFDLEEIK